jgi:glutaredoxin 3
MIEIYGKSSCPKCHQAKAFCETRNLEYTYKQLDKDFTREQIFEWFPGAKTFPQITIDGKSVGGCDQMITYVETMNYQNIMLKG